MIRRPRPRCKECGRELRTRTADRCRDCYLVWLAGPQPVVPDWVVVDRLMSGVRTESTALERAEAVRLLTARGLSAQEISERMHCSARTVTRHRSGVAA